MKFINERIQKLLDDLKGLIYFSEVPISTYRMLKTTERFKAVASLDTGKWLEISNEQIWGGHREYYWFETQITIPPELDGQCVVYRLSTKEGGGWDALNPQFSLYVNGVFKQGMDINHTEALLTENAKAGEKFRIILSAFTGDDNFTLRLNSRIMALDRATEKYYYDIKIPHDVAVRLHAEAAAYITIIKCLNDSLNLLDLRQPRSEAYYASLKEAQKYISGEFYAKHCGDSEATVYSVGHTHIDVAWLWTLAVTRDKAARSFSTVLQLMREYPEYIFMSSQPQLYKFVKENAPEIYAEIKQRVAEGRWETEGGMWVEADCNISSGESLVRQFIYGKRFFREEFGKDNTILWLPDVFGYSAALPQIIDKCGIKYFMTIKISWSDTNRMPCDTFMWEGIDGTRVLTHFIPARDYVDPILKETGKKKQFATYNGMLNASEVMGGWQWYQQKNLNSEILTSFGYGDGGGGPTKEMLENARRLSAGIPGCPKTVMSTSADFFKRLDEHVSGSKELPLWVGELFLEYHRGTYTSIGRNKRYNRRSEFAYQNAELYGVMDTVLNGSAYPAEALHDGWETILLNQFHDILPGSSIKEVYEESREQYEHILKKGGELAGNSLRSIADNVNAPQASLIVFNPNSAGADSTVSFKVPDGIANPVVYDGGERLDAQLTGGGNAIFTARGVPSKGYKTFAVKSGDAPAAGNMTVSARHIENRFFNIQLNGEGQFTSIFDKTAGRELLPEGKRGNVIMSYEDKPIEYDAWDIMCYYTEKSWEVDSVSVIEVVERGPVRATLKIERPYLDSTITQYISVYADMPRIDINNDVDWKEKQVLLKCLFPVDIHASEASFDIQYGNVTRPTHNNTSWDQAKFEVCVHKWLDISESGYGVSVLNDCKYGCHVKDGVIGLTMLKSAIYPSTDADRERHSFAYSIYPHSGGWREGGTVAQAYMFNNPLAAVIKENSGGTLADIGSFVSCDKENVVVEAVKKAEDSCDTVLRLYECYNRRTTVKLRFGVPVKSVCECDMLEENEKPLELDGESVVFEIKPYEIKTLKLKN